MMDSLLLEHQEQKLKLNYILVLKAIVKKLKSIKGCDTMTSNVIENEFINYTNILPLQYHFQI